MSQTSWIAAALFGAFVIYVTARGQLPQYISLVI